MSKYNLSEMTGLDIFLQSLCDTERENYCNEIVPNQYLSPLKSWGMSSEFFKIRKPLSWHQKDNDILAFMASQFLWNTDVTEILNNPYDALVVTDSSNNIIWTNPGFFKMTGYTESYALGKNPSFLQGSATSTETKLSIRNKLLQGKPFSIDVLNYKKNQQEYWCQIQIFPLITNGELSHYLALETELV